MRKRKPIALVHDSAAYLSTFMKLEIIRDKECPDELRDPIFAGRAVFPWHRIQVLAPAINGGPRMPHAEGLPVCGLAGVSAR